MAVHVPCTYDALVPPAPDDRMNPNGDGEFEAPGNIVVLDWLSVMWCRPVGVWCCITETTDVYQTIHQKHNMLIHHSHLVQLQKNKQ